MALVFITGGARSGKSRIAQHLAEQRHLLGIAIETAVFGIPEGDEEFDRRVESHRADRPATFVTLECGHHPEAALLGDPGALLLVDCLGTALGAVMAATFRSLGTALSDAGADALPAGFEIEAGERFERLVDALTARPGPTIVVSNEVGDGVVPLYASARLFRDLLGRANAIVADRADAAYLVVAGRVLELSSLPTRVGWPED